MRHYHDAAEFAVAFVLTLTFFILADVAFSAIHDESTIDAFFTWLGA